MEGLIPFAYRAIMQYKNGNQVALGSWYSDSPSSASYMRLQGDSGRFQATDLQLFQSDYGSLAPNSAATKIILSTGVQSPVCRLTHRHVAT